MLLYKLGILAPNISLTSSKYACLHGLQTTLASVLLAARRLNHTLTRLEAVGTEALLRPRRRGVMAACVSLTDVHSPCLVLCSASKTPERQLYCDMYARVLPRLRNLIHLLQTRVSWSLLLCIIKNN